MAAKKPHVSKMTVKYDKPRKAQTHTKTGALKKTAPKVEAKPNHAGIGDLAQSITTLGREIASTIAEANVAVLTEINAVLHNIDKNIAQLVAVEETKLGQMKKLDEDLHASLRKVEASVEVGTGEDHAEPVLNLAEGITGKVVSTEDVVQSVAKPSELPVPPAPAATGTTKADEVITF